MEEEQKVRWVAFENSEKTVSSGIETCDVAGFKLPAGKYLLHFTFFVFLDNQWLYAGIKGDGYNGNHVSRTIPFDSHQGFYGISSTWMPIAAKHTVTVQDNAQVTFELFSGSSYPSRVRNFMMTAEKIE